MNMFDTSVIQCKQCITDKTRLTVYYDSWAAVQWHVRTQNHIIYWIYEICKFQTLFRYHVFPYVYMYKLSFRVQKLIGKLTTKIEPSLLLRNLKVSHCQSIFLSHSASACRHVSQYSANTKQCLTQCHYPTRLTGCVTQLHQMRHIDSYCIIVLVIHVIMNHRFANKTPCR